MSFWSTRDNRTSAVPFIVQGVPVIVAAVIIVVAYRAPCQGQIRATLLIRMAGTQSAALVIIMANWRLI